MRAQPARAAYLCFEIGGILDERQAEFGTVAKAIPYAKITDYVRSLGTAAADPSRLLGDSAGVLNTVGMFSLASLRNEDRKVALDNAVGSRQNLYFSKYANAASVISTIRGMYWKGSPAATPNLLERLSDLAQQQASALQEAYSEDDRTGVVRSTTSSTEAEGRTTGSSNRAGKFFQESVPRMVPNNTMLPSRPPIPWEGVANRNWTETGYPSKSFKSREAQTVVTTGVTYEDSTNGSFNRGSQFATHTDFEYRTPYIETVARNLRSQISLRDQQFDQFMFGQNIPHLEKIFENELAAIDNDVYQLQLALLRSILVSPVDGVVTGIYKSPGEAVGPGEPVLRVEDDSQVHIVASVVHHGSITPGATATLQTPVAGPGSPVTTLVGPVVAARMEASGGRWEIVVRFANRDAAGVAILPLGYAFDPEFTDVTIA